MSDSYKIDKIIDDCIDRIRSGETIDDASMSILITKMS